MIRIVKKGQKLAEADVMGRYVMKEGPFFAKTFSSPVHVNRLTGTRVYGEALRLGRDSELEADPMSEGVKFMALSSVACICDTLEEATHVVRLGFDHMAAYRELLRNQEKALGELDGVEIAGPEAGTRIP